MQHIRATNKVHRPIIASVDQAAVGVDGSSKSDRGGIVLPVVVVVVVVMRIIALRTRYEVGILKSEIAASSLGSIQT